LLFRIATLLLFIPQMSGQFQCEQIYARVFKDPSSHGGFVLSKVIAGRLYSNGIYVGTYDFDSLKYDNGNGSAWLEVNGIPFTSDPDNPDAKYSLDNGEALLDGLCSGGFYTGPDVEKKVNNEPDLSRLKPKAVAGSPPAAGQAAGFYISGDFNGDGVPDNAQSANGKVIVSIYNSAGQVAATHTYVVGEASGQILAGDFNGDGKGDLAVVVTSSESAQGSIAILLGNGGGTFSAPVNYPAGSYPSPLAMGDFNKDGKLDLAVGGETGSTAASIAGSVSILLGKGDGTFSAGSSYSVGKAPQSMVATDFNGDGNVDLAVLDPGVTSTGASLWVLLGNGDGTFRTPIGGLSGTGQGSLAYADYNQDGKPDILVGDFDFSAIGALAGNGDGSFQAVQMSVAAAQPASVAALALGDGTTAIFTGDALTGNLVYGLTDTAGNMPWPSMQTLGIQPGGVTLADLNGDGKPDIIWTDLGGSAVYILLNSGNGIPLAPVSYAVGSSPAATAVADVNGDGKPDLIVQDANGIEVLLGTGNGAFGKPQASGASGQLPASAIAVGDFNGDGKRDVAALTPNGGVSILLGNGAGTFTAGTSVQIPGGSMAASLVAVDFNLDGKLDLAVSYNPQNGGQAGSVMVLLGDGEGGFQTSSTLTLPGTAGGLAAADLNNDGKPDLLARSYAPNSIQVALGKGDGTFQALATVRTATAGPGIVVTDLTGNGHEDLVLSDCCGLSEASFLYGKGDGTFEAEVQFPSGSNPQFIAAADLAGDGRPDLAIAGYALNKGTLVLGRSVFGAATNSLTVLSAAGGVSALAPGSLASSYGSDLYTGQPVSPGLPWPSSSGGTKVTIMDSGGTSTAGLLTYLSTGQVNFEIPDSVATGAATVTVTASDGTTKPCVVPPAGCRCATVTVTASDGTTTTGQVTLTPMAPSLFTLNSANLAAAYATCVSSSGAQTSETPFQLVNGALTAQALNLGACSQTVLELYGTGLDKATAAGVQVTIGGLASTVLYAGPGGGFPGLDQVNVLIPMSLIGAGSVKVALTAGGMTANTVNITVQ
jgi:uncharacterized protein (TIGR03437 family)